MMNALTTFFDQYVFGHDRDAQLLATSADHAEQQARFQAHLRTELARIDVAERALIRELLNQPTPPPTPTATASPNAPRSKPS